jgi:hypothetical protein
MTFDPPEPKTCLPSMFSSGGSRVSLTASRAAETQAKTTATSGPSSPESFATLVPAGYWQKTSPDCSQVVIPLFSEMCQGDSSDEYSEIWPNSGSMRNGIVYRLPRLAPRTSETGSFYWPTPTVRGNNNRKGISKEAGDGLATAVLRTITSGPMRSITGRLSPDWVEWLMGFPIGWTAFDASETRSSLNRRQFSVGRSSTPNIISTGSDRCPTESSDPSI